MYTADATISATVTVQDAFGNTVNDGAAASSTVALGSSVGNGGTLTSDSSLSKGAVNGVASFTDLHVRKAGGPYAIYASSTGLTAATSSSFSVTHGAATKLAFTSQPASTYTADETISVSS